MTDEELDAIEARVRDTHPGPWTHEVSCHRNDHGERIPHIGPLNGEGTICVVDSDFWTEDADAAFIAHAREDVPALIAEVRRRADYDEIARLSHHYRNEAERWRAEAERLSRFYEGCEPRP